MLRTGLHRVPTMQHGLLTVFVSSEEHSVLHTPSTVWMTRAHALHP